MSDEMRKILPWDLVVAENPAFPGVRTLALVSKDDPPRLWAAFGDPAELDALHEELAEMFLYLPLLVVAVQKVEPYLKAAAGLAAGRSRPQLANTFRSLRMELLSALVKMNIGKPPPDVPA